MAAYGKKKITERHRHRYEFTNNYRREMEESGMVFAGFTPDDTLVECIEWPQSGELSHPWGVAVQVHPEYKAKPMAASPLFRNFIASVKKNK
jgi:CTP synthase